MANNRMLRTLIQIEPSVCGSHWITGKNLVQDSVTHCAIRYVCTAIPKSFVVLRIFKATERGSATRRNARTSKQRDYFKLVWLKSIAAGHRPAFLGCGYSALGLFVVSAVALMFFRRNVGLWKCLCEVSLYRLEFHFAGEIGPFVGVVFVVV